MTTEATTSVPLVQIEVLVPVAVPAKRRARFEQSLARFLFGNERVRPELRDALEEEGIDFNHLASLASLAPPPPLGVCPSPGAVEFVPSDRLAEVCRRHGIDLTSGGSALMTFVYDAYDGGTKPRPGSRRATRPEHRDGKRRPWTHNDPPSCPAPRTCAGSTHCSWPWRPTSSCGSSSSPAPRRS